ncbi:RagB/SusD family nutrient uptake outer membrane protein [uncultured Chryseobacterium sp.]|uniref:RagB/SusD family nutrient uptake outer membrane protein n=1 Tax=uncultured Chryseobacterium sp. TaxID=259322 RepID=UPI0025D9B4FD|nr:RagB/SusD family nutrient uptake outer membrane protein [uncultured Chryseobacterium sp.]
MKKSFLKIFLVAGLFSISSCSDDLLEPYTPGSLTEEQALTTVADLRLLINAAYANFNSRSESEFVSVFTDEVGIGYANGGQGLSAEWVFQMTPNSNLPTSIWAESYASLARINRVIEYGDKVTSSTATGNTTNDRKKILAEAYALRAYHHLRILSYFSPNMKDNSALAGILATKSFEYTDPGQNRSTNGEFYNLIFSDLDKSIALFNEVGANSINTANDRLFANKFFAMGIKARAYAYRGDYTNAEIWANNVLTQSGVVLANKTQYRNMFFTDSDLTASTATSEVIFKLKRNTVSNSQGYNLHNAWCSVRPRLDGSPFYEVGRSLHNILNPANLPASGLSTSIADVRANVIIAPSSRIDPGYATSFDYRNSDVIVINKHGGVATGTATAAVTTSNGFNNDIKIMRLSEMYLIKAEARAAAGDYAGAAAAVDAIRDVRYGSNQAAPVYANATAAWRGILNERRVEFAFEGYRFIDLKRLGALAGTGVDRNPADYSSSSANFPAANPSNLPITSYKWTLPIPQIETNANPGIVQNQGY